MAKDNYPEEKDDIMSQIEQRQLEEILLDKAYNNAYLVLSGQITFDELLGYTFDHKEQMVMAFDPDCGPKKHELENMIDHWIAKEEYEKCQKLLGILHKAYPETIRE